MPAESFLPPIPKGKQILVGISVTGIQHRKDAAIDFINGSDQAIEIQHEPNNQYDENAIRVIGVFRNKWGIRRKAHIGYIPKETSTPLVLGGFLDKVETRMARIFVSDSGFIDIQFQLIADKPAVKEWGARPSVKPRKAKKEKNEGNEENDLDFSDVPSAKRQKPSKLAGCIAAIIFVFLVATCACCGIGMLGKLTEQQKEKKDK